MKVHSITAALLATCGVLLSIGPARAEAPAYIPIQGYLADASDTPIDGAVSIRFRLYDKATAGEVLFDETKSVVNLNKGYFTVYLGEETPIALSVFRDHPIVFVGVLVSGDTAELSPRLQLATAPYAAFAQSCGDASTLGGQAASAFRPSSYVPQWAEVTGKPTAFAPTSHSHAWSEITSGIPAGLADGDNNTTYTAGTGLTLSGANQFSVNTAAIQTKLGAACPAGQYAYGANANGSLMCRADLDTTYSAGTGIALNPSTKSLSVDTAASLPPLVKVLGSRADLGFTAGLQPYIQAGTNILQTNSGGYATLTYNAPFPNGVLGVVPVNGDPAVLSFAAQVQGYDRSSATVYVGVANVSVRINWIAVGW